MAFECINHIEKLRQEQANIDGRVHAIGWSGLFNAFSGDKNSAPIKFTELLPFPDQIKEQKRNKVSDKTRIIINEAIKKRELPIQTLTALAMLLEL